MVARFGLGDCRATVGAMEALAVSGGEWGELDAHDRAVNESALQTGARLLSSYTVSGERIWVITEAGRTQTIILLPEEY